MPRLHGDQLSISISCPLAWLLLEHSGDISARAPAVQAEAAARAAQLPAALPGPPGPGQTPDTTPGPLPPSSEQAQRDFMPEALVTVPHALGSGPSHSRAAESFEKNASPSWEDLLRTVRLCGGTAALCFLARTLRGSQAQHDKAQAWSPEQGQGRWEGCRGIPQLPSTVLPAGQRRAVRSHTHLRTEGSRQGPVAAAAGGLWPRVGPRPRPGCLTFRSEPQRAGSRLGPLSTDSAAAMALTWDSEACGAWADPYPLRRSQAGDKHGEVKAGAPGRAGPASNTERTQEAHTLLSCLPLAG